MNDDLAPQRGYRKKLATVCAILFLTFLDNTIVSVILANIQKDLHFGVSGLEWVVNSYMLPFAVLMLTFGTIGDLYGRKKVMLVGVAVFSAGAALAMLAFSKAMLLGGRVVMGVGAAACEPGTLSMIRHIYPERRARARAYGVWAAVAGLALALGPIIGGLLLGFSGWRAVFGFSLGFGILAFVVGAVVLPESKDPEGRKLDVPGLLLGGLALACVTFATIWGETAGYTAWWILTLYAAAVVSFVALLQVERHRSDPVLKPRFFHDSSFVGANIVALAQNFGAFAVFFFVALYLEIIVGLSGYKIAIAFIAMSVAIVIGAMLSGRWTGTRGPRWPGVLGCALSGVGILIVYGTLGPAISTWTLAWSLGIVGLGFGLTIVAMSYAALTAIPPRQSGVAASTLNTMREIGGITGVAVLGALMSAELTHKLLAELEKLGVPVQFRELIMAEVTHGGLTGNTSHGTTAGAASAAAARYGEIVHKVIQAAYRAFGDGLHVALLTAGIVLLVAAVCAFFMIHQPVSQQEERHKAARSLLSSRSTVWP